MSKAEKGVLWSCLAAMVIMVLFTVSTSRDGKLYWEQLFGQVTRENKEFKLDVSESAFVKPDNVKITFLSVADDSRCSHVESPTKMLACDDLTAGQVGIWLGVEDKQRLMTEMYFVENYEGSKALAQLRWNDYLIKLARVDPYPVFDPGKKGVYTVTLVVVKENN